MKSFVLGNLIGRRAFLALAAVLLISEAAHGAIVPSDRLITWKPGIPGGIPNRSSVYTTLAAGASLSSIQTGTYQIPNTLIIPSYVTLRGVGTNTILNLTGGGAAAGVCMGLNQGSGILYSVPPTVSITSGYTKGSTNLVLSSASGIAVGDLVSITQDILPLSAR